MEIHFTTFYDLKECLERERSLRLNQVNKRNTYELVM